jgi:hypothetical protein
MSEDTTEVLMTGSEERLAALGTAIPEITLPGGDVDLQKWAVIACDQFTQDRSYWEDVRKTAGASPSALNIIFPEIYLGEAGREDRVQAIHRTMASYLTGVLAPAQRRGVYIERSTPYHQRRRGLILAIDLEQYDWKPGSQTLIRATEETVPERIPPRMEIRRSAPLEIPHILLLMDDEADYLIPALGERAKKGSPLYHTPLMLGAGEISGWALNTETDWMVLTEGLEELAARSETRYGQGKPLLYAVGDGNHSLATAKAVWEEYKKTHTGREQERYPGRYALVELENLSDPGISFEPIHRVIFGAVLEEVRAALSELPGFTSRTVKSAEELSQLVTDNTAGNRYGLTGEGRYILVETGTTGIATGELQPLLDRFISAGTRTGGLGIDYIHGDEELFRIASGGGGPAVGLLLPPVQKAGLFQTIARSGPLPRKSFSMGEAVEKRFYLECRRLF